MDDSLISDLLMETKSRNASPPQSFGRAFLTSPAKSRIIGLTMQAVPNMRASIA